MRKFIIPCTIGNETTQFTIYVGEPSAKAHPLHFQSLWLQQERGGQISSEVMDSFQKLHDISLENGVSFEELCVYALETTSKTPPEEENKNG